MRIKLQLIMCNDQGDAETVTDVITLDKNHQRIEHLGLSLAESKQFLSTLQRHLLQLQVTTFLDTCSDCPDCGTPLKLKARAHRSFRTRAWRCWGLGRHRHLLSLHVQVRIPALEDTGQFPVERPHSRL